MSQLFQNFSKESNLVLKKYKRLVIVCTSIVVLFFVVLAVMVYMSIRSLQQAPAVYKHQLYSLNKGENASTVVDSFVSNPIEAQIDHMWLRFHKEYTAVQKGDYLVDGKKSLLDILKDMVAGNVVEKIYPTFAIVEGTNLSKILNAAKKRKIVDNKFNRFIKDEKTFMEEIFSDQKELLEFVGGSRDNIEGFVNPATYPMYEENPLYHMFKRGMINQVKILKKEWEERDKSIQIKTPYEALILASLIERETFLDEERPMVASVFENRLQKSMRLQTDPAVMYGVSRNFTGRLTKAHLKTDTPYNTYTREGLPPTPICMPQEKSIRAALHPDKTKYLYFVAKDVTPKAGHSFSTNLDAHNKAVSAYRKRVRDYHASKNEEDSDDDLIKAEADAQAKAADSTKSDSTADKAKSTQESKADTLSTTSQSANKESKSKASDSKANATAQEKDDSPLKTSKKAQSTEKGSEVVIKIDQQKLSFLTLVQFLQGVS